jgi:Aminotransferase class-III
MEITARPPLVFVRGQGSWLWDHEGKRYLDFVQGWAVNCLGHSPPVIAKTLADQSQKLITPSPAFYNEPSIQLAQRIVDHSCFQRVFFTNSGAEANEGAIKLARKWGALNKGGATRSSPFRTPSMAAPWPPGRRPASRTSAIYLSRRHLELANDRNRVDLNSRAPLFTSQKSVPAQRPPLRPEAGHLATFGRPQL